MNISENDNALDLNLAMEVCEYFHLTKEQAEQIINEVKRFVQNRRALASKYGISKAEQDLKSLAFTKSED